MKHFRLEQLGAAKVVGREEVSDSSGKPLLRSRWSGGIDTVGGNTLATLLRSAKNGACLAACGLVGGTDLALTVYPFILRGVTLAGIDSAWCPRDERIDVWHKLAGLWKLDGLAELSTRTTLTQIDEHVQKTLAGDSLGRVVIDLNAK